ncbi:MAG: hypothetical protein KAU49_02075 [Candidatus Krumholzibacteria bacterium]|nr:hypothetical protein [Candidatus Krumholzibacteria bacterium]
MGSNRNRALFLVAALAVLSSACSKKVVLTDIDEGLFVPGAGIEAAATFIDDPGVFKSLFKCYPPDSGVVPVYVTVKNVDSRPVQIHNLNYLPLNDTFRGFTLELGENSLDPIHPLEAVMYIKGKAKIPNYREIRAGHVVAGIIVWPLGIYYIFRGVQYSREYKPLLRNSFFPAGRGGNFDPVTLAPGEVASGFIYFALLPEDNPYYRDEADLDVDRRGKVKPSLKVKSGGTLMVNINPAVNSSTYGDCEITVDTMLTVRGLKQMRSEDGSPAQWAGHPSPEDLFALIANEKRGAKLDLVAGSSEELFESRSAEVLTVISELSGKKAGLVDASRWGNRGVCGVNFKQKSRLYLVEWVDGRPVLIAEAVLDRKIMSVIAAEDAIYVTGDNGFCHTFEYDDLRTRRYLNMSNSVSDIVMTGGKLVTFGKKTVMEYEIIPGHNPQRLRQLDISSSGKTDAGLAGEGVVVTHQGRGTHGDTLVLYDPESLEEVARQPFPGRLDIIDKSADGVLVQMTGGTIMRIARQEGEYSTCEAGWIPVLATASSRSGGIVTLVSEEMRLYSFRLDSVVPEPLYEGGAVSVPIGVGTPYGKVEKKKEKRIR